MWLFLVFCIQVCSHMERALYYNHPYITYSSSHVYAHLLWINDAETFPWLIMYYKQAWIVAFFSTTRLLSASVQRSVHLKIPQMLPSIVVCYLNAMVCDLYPNYIIKNYIKCKHYCCVNKQITLHTRKIPTPNIIANVRHAWLYEWAVCAMWTKLKLSSDGGYSDRKKCIRDYGGAYGGVWREYGAWSQAVGFVLLRLAAICFQSPWRCFHD
jgi:hypothetical protein